MRPDFGKTSLVIKVSCGCGDGGLDRGTPSLPSDAAGWKFVGLHLLKGPLKYGKAAE